MDLSYFQDPETGEFKSRPLTKTYEQVEAVIQKHKGNNDAVVNRFIAMYLDSVQWDWFASYQEWQVALLEVEEWNEEFAGSVSHTNTVRVVEGDGDDAVVSYEEVEVLHEAKPLPIEPVRPYEQSVDEWRLANYSTLRAAAYPSQTDQLAMQYDDATNNTTTWLDSQNAVKGQYPK